MAELTEAQKRAVEATDRSVCVSAGAGTGKTRVLVERFIYLVEKGRARSDEILAITFTEKAAQEMKARIGKRLRECRLETARRELENAYIGTIHSFCARILREHPMEVGVDPDFRVLEEEQANLFQDIVLDDLMENRFQEPVIFDLLSVYSELGIREAIQTVAKRVHAFGSSISEIASSLLGSLPRNDAKGAVEQANASPKQSQSNVLNALQPLKRLNARQSDCEQMEAVLAKSISNWEELETVKETGKRFRKQGKAKGDIVVFRDLLDDWLRVCVESLGQRARDAFLSLARDFEIGYQGLKRARSALDFNDLEREAVRLLKGSEPRSVACRRLYSERFKFVMVDEFQDTSPLQDQLIRLISRQDNQFIVGDWKQSIYGFRGTEAALFLEREKAFSSDGSGVRIPLVGNFRSRPELLKQINPFFEHLWADEGKSFEALEPGRPVIAGQTCPNAGGQADYDGCVEFLTVERKEGETVEEVRMNEARILAERIRALVASGAYEYRHVAMLFRVATDIYFYEHELKNLDVPYYVVSGRGFYRQPEIRDLITFLELLENPHLDIPLASVLRSPLVQISDDALFWLAHASKGANPNTPLYDAFLKCDGLAEICEEDQARLKNFKTFFFELLERKEKWTISECLELVMERTRYDRAVLARPQGKRHFANLRKLLEIAREVEAREPVHLGDFIRHVKGLETQEVRESEAQVEALEGDVVKLMTIHKAKGLEFKVVIIPDLNRKGEKRHTRFLMDPEYGLGHHVWNEATRNFEETWTYRKIKEKIARQAGEESKRLFYVGMTRAEDRLILSGSSKEQEEEAEADGVDDKTNWYAWMDGWLRSGAGGGWAHKVVQRSAERKGRIHLPLADHKRIRAALERHEAIRMKIPNEAARIKQSLKPITPVYFERIDLPVTAYSVFESNPESYRKTYELGALPEEDVKEEEWMLAEDEASISGAGFGTLIHQVFEYLVLQPNEAKKRLDEILKRLISSLESMAVEEVRMLTKQFISSEVFAEIKSARARHAEIPFVLRLQAGIVQGTVDLFYQTRSGDWVILDYKTNQVSTEGVAQEAERYRSQMMLYALACHELLHLTLRRATLYFVRPNQTFDFDLQKMEYLKLRQQFESMQKEIISYRRDMNDQ